MLGGATLIRLAFGKRHPAWSGIMLFGMGGLLLHAGLDRLRSPKSVEYLAKPSKLPFDIVTEDSEESFPASDPPSFAMGVR